MWVLGIKPTFPCCTADAFPVAIFPSPLLPENTFLIDLNIKFTVIAELNEFYNQCSKKFTKHSANIDRF